MVRKLDNMCVASEVRRSGGRDSGCCLKSE